MTCPTLGGACGKNCTVRHRENKWRVSSRCSPRLIPLPVYLRGGQVYCLSFDEQFKFAQFREPPHLEILANVDFETPAISEYFSGLGVVDFRRFSKLPILYATPMPPPTYRSSSCLPSLSPLECPLSDTRKFLTSKWHLIILPVSLCGPCYSGCDLSHLSRGNVRGS